MTKFVDLTDKYKEINGYHNFNTYPTKLSDYEYAKRKGKDAETCAYLHFRDVEYYAWLDDIYTRCYYSGGTTTCGEIEYEQIPGKDRRVLYPTRINYYVDGKLLEYATLTYNKFLHVSTIDTYYRAADHANDDPNTFMDQISLLPVLLEWFDGVIITV